MEAGQEEEEEESAPQVQQFFWFQPKKKILDRSLNFHIHIDIHSRKTSDKLVYYYIIMNNNHFPWTSVLAFFNSQ